MALKSFRAHTEPIFKQLNILNFTDKLSYCRAVFMHQYRHEKLPTSFSGIFNDVTCTDDLQTRHNDYNYVNEAAIKRSLESFPYKQIICNWNALDIDLKSTSDIDEFGILLKEKYLSTYRYEMDCPSNCYSCYGN